MPEVASSKDRPAVRRAVLASVLAVLFFTARAGSDGVPTPPDMREVLGGCPVLQGALSGAILKQVIVDDPLGAAVCRLYASKMGGNCYVAWSRSKPVQLSSVMTGHFWVLDCRDTEMPAGDEAPVDAGDIWISADPTAIMPCAPASPVIASIAVDGSPMKPFHSEGDLWMSTWADDGWLYSGWGDGAGVKAGTIWTDCGVARLSGSLPNLAAEEMCFTAPTATPNVNDKPSSLLCINGRLIGAFHSPLGDAWIGYLAYSDDHGASWTRVGFHEEGDLWPVGGSPWVRDTNSPFRCLFFINMGQDYSLNTDGYVYALGIGTEWSWTGPVRLARVPTERVLEYAAYEYFAGTNDDGSPRWSREEREAAAFPGVRASEQGSAMFHPGIGRYLFLTARTLYDAPEPWGPWTYAGSWGGASAPVEWQGGYQPGIISKDAGPDSFWFTIAGQNKAPKIEYCLNLGRMVMTLR
jgi:hypothetical protein